MSNFIRWITYPIRKVQWERRIAARIRRLDASHAQHIGTGYKHRVAYTFAQRERMAQVNRNRDAIYLVAAGR